MNLHSRIPGLRLAAPMILRVATGVNSSASVREREVLLLDRAAESIDANFPLVLSRPGGNATYPILPSELDYVREGDILRIGLTGDVAVLYRKESRHNSMLVTERCNSRCVMCSQPPRDIDDDYLIEDWLSAIPLMSPNTKELGITGGEPTLRYEKFLALVRAVKTHLPTTALHVLSNGRLFCYLKYAERLAECEHCDLMLGIPLYADVDDIHDQVVQAKGAFAQTVSGIVNLARVHVKIEIRFVIHRLTYQRLPHFARFVARNLPFVDHVALMGLELMGFARTNLGGLWIDPVEYHSQVEEAVAELTWAHLKVSLYNLPLCLLPKATWGYARQSISDWKNVYLPECDRCAVKDHCAGFFASSDLHHSAHIHALGATERTFLDETVGLNSSRTSAGTSVKQKPR